MDHVQRDKLLDMFYAGPEYFDRPHVTESVTEYLQLHSNSSLDAISAAKIIAIWDLNCYTTGKGAALFPIVAKISHSCMPNVTIAVSTESGPAVATVRTRRPVASGQVVASWYLPDVDTFWMDTEIRRVEITKERGFQCNCCRCNDVDRTRGMRCFSCATSAFASASSPPSSFSRDKEANLLRVKSSCWLDACGCVSCCLSSPCSFSSSSSFKCGSSGSARHSMSPSGSCRQPDSSVYPRVGAVGVMYRDPAVGRWRCSRCGCTATDAAMNVKLEHKFKRRIYRMHKSLRDLTSLSPITASQAPTSLPGLAAEWTLDHLDEIRELADEVEETIGCHHWMFGWLHKVLSSSYSLSPSSTGLAAAHGLAYLDWFASVGFPPVPAILLTSIFQLIFRCLAVYCRLTAPATDIDLALVAIVDAVLSKADTSETMDSKPNTSSSKDASHQNATTIFAKKPRRRELIDKSAENNLKKSSAGKDGRILCFRLVRLFLSLSDPLSVPPTVLATFNGMRSFLSGIETTCASCQAQLCVFGVSGKTEPQVAMRTASVASTAPSSPPSANGSSSSTPPSPTPLGAGTLNSEPFSSAESLVASPPPAYVVCDGCQILRYCSLVCRQADAKLRHASACCSPFSSLLDCADKTS
eukprot:GHVT01091017.1.p1 GENE.GHVT01091017.1~~GHVT01091017.1.p1  ORF type:complete len:751 (+),score=87.92 GHVT01091017.1:336-2255(+)